MNWFKKNWITILSAIIALLSGADLTTGVAQGKSLLNVANLPAIGIGGSAVVTMLLRWINSRTVTTRLAPAGLPDEITRLIEAIFVVAESPDIDENMVSELGCIAACIVEAHAGRLRKK